MHPANPDRGEGMEPVGSEPPFWRKPNFLYYWLPPLLWGLAVLSLSGDVGSDTNTRHLLQWLLSWLVALKPAQIDLINFFLRKTGHVLAYGCGKFHAGNKRRAYPAGRRFPRLRN